MGCNCCDGKFIILFLKQFFDIGKSTGSLFGEIISLFKTFQKVSAPSEFSTKFSRECLDMLRWATDIFYNIANSIRTNPFTDFEIFSIYTYILPLTILCFISIVMDPKFSFFTLLLYGFFIMFGVGLGTIPDELVISIPCLVSSVLVVVAYYVSVCKEISLLYCLSSCCNKNSSEDRTNSGGTDMLSLLNGVFISCLIFGGLSFPIISTRYKVQLILICAVAIICIVIICLTLITKSLLPHLYEKILLKIVNFIFSLIPLLIIPSTERFVAIIQGSYKGQWTIITSYIGIALLIPILITLLMIIKGNSELSGKYHEGFYSYIELVDNLRQIAYAVLAAYDILWGCVGVEIGWILIVFIVRPYTNVSEYTLSVGNSLVVLISNGLLLYTNYNPMKTFGFTVTIVFIVIACIPAILSFYMYFAFDFSLDDDKSDANLEFEESVETLSIFAISITPLAWSFYGLVIPIFCNMVEFKE